MGLQADNTHTVKENWKHMTHCKGNKEAHDSHCKANKEAHKVRKETRGKTKENPETEDWIPRECTGHEKNHQRTDHQGQQCRRRTNPGTKDWIPRKTVEGMRKINIREQII